MSTKESNHKPTPPKPQPKTQSPNLAAGKFSGAKTIRFRDGLACLKKR